MSRVRLYSLILALATLAFVAYGAATGALRGVALFATAAAALVLLPGARRYGRRFLDRWLVMTTGGIYSLMMVGAIGLAYLQHIQLTERALLVLFMMLGVLLSLRAGYVATRKRQYGFHNYFDRPAT